MLRNKFKTGNFRKKPLYKVQVIVMHCLYELSEPKKKLKDLKSHLKMKFGSLNEEIPEQLMAVRFIKGQNHVLEIGGNLGRNAIVIASILDDQENLVTLEPNAEFATKLAVNRDINGFNFHIENAALSEEKLVQDGWKTISADEAEGNEFNEVKTLTFSELEEKYGIRFDTLVIDCEGAFYQIIKEFPYILDKVSLVLIENDYSSLEEKRFVDDIFRNRGFKKIYNKIGPYSPCQVNFYEAWRK
jgi:FkbM family methyltransferase